MIKTYAIPLKNPVGNILLTSKQEEDGTISAVDDTGKTILENASTDEWNFFKACYLAGLQRGRILQRQIEIFTVTSN